MVVKTSRKNKLTEKLRRMIKDNVPQAKENDRAETFICTISFQSTTYPERQVWIDTDLDGIGVDLEDWNIEEEWDNAVARVTVDTIEEAAELVQTWLSGNSLDKYTNLNKDYEKISKL